MRLWAVVIVGAGVGLGMGPAQAQDMATGEAIYERSCKNCHGPTAQGMASFPKLSDKSADYLSEKLRQYRAGEQVGPNTALMRPNAAGLSDAEIASVAAYIAESFE
jgi:cytochrome c553